MPVWYEVEKSEDGIINFMKCNWHFHDFLIGQASYFPAKQMVELLMEYDTPNDNIILRFLKVKDFHFQTFDNPCDSMIYSSILKLSEDGCFSWYSSDDCPENDEELKNNSTWVEAENIIWAITDENGNPSELPEDKINQVWNNYGNTEYKHFQLKEYSGDKEAAMKEQVNNKNIQPSLQCGGYLFTRTEVQMNSQNIKEKLLKEKTAKEKTISQCQNRIKEIDAKLTELDNTEIIGIVRAFNLSPEQLSELLRKGTKKDDKNE